MCPQTETPRGASGIIIISFTVKFALTPNRREFEFLSYFPNIVLNEYSVVLCFSDPSKSIILWNLMQAPSKFHNRELKAIQKRARKQKQIEQMLTSDKRKLSFLFFEYFQSTAKWVHGNTKEILCFWEWNVMKWMIYSLEGEEWCQQRNLWQIEEALSHWLHLLGVLHPLLPITLNRKDTETSLGSVLSADGTCALRGMIAARLAVICSQQKNLWMAIGEGFWLEPAQGLGKLARASC